MTERFLKMDSDMVAAAKAGWMDAAECGDVVPTEVIEGHFEQAFRIASGERDDAHNSYHVYGITRTDDEIVTEWDAMAIVNNCRIRDCVRVIVFRMSPSLSGSDDLFVSAKIIGAFVEGVIAVTQTVYQERSAKIYLQDPVDRAFGDRMSILIADKDLDVQVALKGCWLHIDGV